MPAFVENGPNIPEHLLQAHEDGRVVFFCGAGVSAPAGLPGFAGLVDKIYEELGTKPEPIEDQAFKNEQYDAALHQLELRYPGGRFAVREKLASILKPNLDEDNATRTHEALLQLATDRNNKVRLVTTNFDRIFQHIVENQESYIPSFSAPLLPIPKPSRWHGVVYLHGLLPDMADETELNRLVLTSGDFGLAYLTERWAARFVSELFRNYTVCFVGYGINDPVMRYMMDALAADELLGETKPAAYAFASYSDDDMEQARIEWKAKGVTPLLYEVPAGEQDHSLLHRTLKEWASTYRDGVLGKEMIIAQHASTPPLASSQSDFAVGRVLWALTDEQAAKHFADLNPVPPLEWLEPLSGNLFGYEDLSRFGITANSKHDAKLSFSFLQRPMAYTHSPRMCVLNMGERSRWDGVMIQLARWLIRHLDDPKLIIWLADRGGQLHTEFASLIHNQLEKLEQLDAKGELSELDRILADAPKAIPGPLMNTLWQLVLSGRIKTNSISSAFYDLERLIKTNDGVTASLRMALREGFKPCLKLRKPFRWGQYISDPLQPQCTKDLVEWELVLAGDDSHYWLDRFEKYPQWQATLPNLLRDFTLLLQDACDLIRELGEADNQRDSSHIHQPSISKHSQNGDLHDWTVLIELVRDAWLATVRKDLAVAQHAAEGWWYIPYPVFKRLAFFAAAQNEVISQRQALDWLLVEDCWWLWSGETQRESIRLLVALASKLSKPERLELESAILKGPPQKLLDDDFKPEYWTWLIDQKMWLRLSKLEATGAVLGENAKTKLDELRQQYPNWLLAEDERDEFLSWVEEERPEFSPTPRRRRELVEWLKEHSKSDFREEDDWHQRCRDDFPTTACALCALAKENYWPVDRWHEALQAWSQSQHFKQSWRYIGPVLENTPDSFVSSLSHPLSCWLKAMAKTFDDNKNIFLSLCRRVIEVDHQDKSDIEDAVYWAINHPIGLVTEALLHFWYRGKPEDGQGLPESLKSTFTQLCDTQIEKFRPGHVLLAAHAVNLYRVDPDWASERLLPLFDWQDPLIEARLAWEGFLWSPHLNHPLLSAIKKPFLEAAEHYKKLGKHPEQYADFLTFVALDQGDIFTKEELAKATKKLPPDGLASAIQTLTRTLVGAGDQRSEYWKNRVSPYLHNIWPKSNDLATPEISENFARLCATAGDAFPEAWKELQYWIKPVEYTDYVVHSIHEANLCEQFPDDTLAFLNAVVSDHGTWYSKDLQQCLDNIKQANSQLASDTHFIRLSKLVRDHGGV